MDKNSSNDGRSKVSVNSNNMPTSDIVQKNLCLLLKMNQKIDKSMSSKSICKDKPSILKKKQYSVLRYYSKYFIFFNLTKSIDYPNKHDQTNYSLSYYP